MDEAKVRQKDANLSRKMEAVRILQRLADFACASDFTGSVTVTIHASKGKLQKIVDCHEGHNALE